MMYYLPMPAALWRVCRGTALCEMTGETIKQSAQPIGEPIKGRVKRATRLALSRALHLPGALPGALQMQLLRVADAGGTVSVGDIVVAVEPVDAVVSPNP